MSENTRNLLEKLGIQSTHVHVTYNPADTKTSDMLLGIKYLVTSPSYELLKEYDVEYEEIFIASNLKIYKNPFYLSLGYGVNKEILNTNMNNDNTFELQNKILKNMTGIQEDVYTEHKGIMNKNVNGFETEKNKYKKINDNAKITYEFTIENTETAYVYILAESDEFIEIYLNDELLSSPTINEKLETEVLNIAPLTLEDANRIADCINLGEDSSYTTYKADSNIDDKTDKIKQKLVGTWKYQGEDIFAYLIDTLVFNSDGSVKNTAMRFTYIGTYDVIEDNSIKLTFTDNTGYAPATDDWNGEYTIDDFSIELKYDESSHSISVPSDEYEERGYFKGYTYSVAEHDEPSPGSAVPDNYTTNNYNSNEYTKPEVAYYYTINAKAIPKADGSYTFYHICPYCGEETPALSAVKNRKVKCRFSGCTGRTAGYTYTIEAIYN